MGGSEALQTPINRAARRRDPPELPGASGPGHTARLVRCLCSWTAQLRVALRRSLYWARCALRRQAQRPLTKRVAQRLTHPVFNRPHQRYVQFVGRRMTQSLFVQSAPVRIALEEIYCFAAALVGDSEEFSFRVLCAFQKRSLLSPVIWEPRKAHNALKFESKPFFSIWLRKISSIGKRRVKTGTRLHICQSVDAVRKEKNVLSRRREDLQTERKGKRIRLH